MLYFTLMLSQQEDTMKVTALCFRLLMLHFTLLSAQVQNSHTQKSDAVFLRIIPNRLQHFQFSSISFDCGRSDGLAQLRVIRSSNGYKCNINMTLTESSCTIERAYLEDSGEYWCETTGQERSNSVDITVTAGLVILESPILPVTEGNNVTLHCRTTETWSNLSVSFYKDGVRMAGSPVKGMTIKNVSKSHEGLYKCSISGVGTSPVSWLAVRETLSDNSDTPHVFILLWVAVTVLTMALVVGFLQFRKHRVSGDGVTEDESSVTYAVVVIKQRKDKDSAGAADHLSICLETNHSAKPQSYTESGLSSSTVTLDSTPATDPNLPETEIFYSPI